MTISVDVGHKMLNNWPNQKVIPLLKISSEIPKGDIWGCIKKPSNNTTFFYLYYGAIFFGQMKFLYNSAIEDDKGKNWAQILKEGSINVIGVKRLFPMIFCHWRLPLTAKYITSVRLAFILNPSTASTRGRKFSSKSSAIPSPEKASSFFLMS